MTALAQSVDDIFLVREPRFAQFSERREETLVVQGLGMDRVSAPAGEQQQHEQPLRAWLEETLH